MRNWLYLIIVVLTFFLAIVVVLNYQQRAIREIEENKGAQENLVAHSACLADDEVAGYEIKKKEEGGGIAEIFIKNKKDNTEIFSFQINISNPDPRSLSPN
ncbi:hypothetical protein KAW43_00975 [Candidatus Parcubacteria bacterium]|nr:hypothetical protein [Candidatus Parcubacteria bacterium]